VEFPPLPDLSKNAALSDIEILKLEVGSPLHAAARARQLNYEQNWYFQDRWVALLLSVEAVVGGDGRMSQVHCKVCSHVEGQEKLLVAKIDSLWKHTRRRKALTTFGQEKKGNF
jgi:hypothetical protein